MDPNFYPMWDPLDAVEKSIEQTFDPGPTCYHNPDIYMDSDRGLLGFAFFLFFTVIFQRSPRILSPKASNMYFCKCLSIKNFTRPYKNLTERAGFEPAVRINAHWFSKPAPSATRTPLLQCSYPLVYNRPALSQMINVSNH